MTLSALFNLFRTYVILGIIFAIILCLTWLCLHFFVFRRRQIKPPLRKVILYAIFICYVTVVAGAVFLSRPENVFRAATYLQPLFLFRVAWHNFSFVAWRNLIFNILMFVPFGILLPLLSDKLKSLWKTVGIGFGTSLLIEIVQYITGRGQASTDDVITNTLGALIGYGLIMAWLTIRHKAERSQKKIVGYLSPLFISALVFLSIFTAYYAQDFGNMPSNLHRQSMRNVDVSTITELSDVRAIATVYQTESFNRAQARDFADSFFEQNGNSMNPERPPLFYQYTAFFYSVGGCILSVNFQTQTFRYINFSSDAEADSTLSEAEVRFLLADYGMDVPINAEFINNGYGEYIFSIDDAGSGQWQLGRLRCRVRNDGTIREIDNAIFNFFAVAEREVISEAEAFKRIEEGRFQIWHHYELQTIEILSVEIDYSFDTKGFFRPIYVFDSLINGSEVVSIAVPAF